MIKFIEFIIYAVLNLQGLNFVIFGGFGGGADEW